MPCPELQALARQGDAVDGSRLCAARTSASSHWMADSAIQHDCDDGGNVSATSVEAHTPDQSEHLQVQAELAYDQVIDHARRCPTCWPWRDELWSLTRLCLFGRELVERYAAMEVRRARRDHDEPNAEQMSRAHG